MSYWDNQLVLITGSSRGIGRDLAKRFSGLGCKVAINYLSDEVAANETLKECAPERTQLYRADVSDETQVSRMVSDIKKKQGSVTVLVNNAGQIRDSLLVMMTKADWDIVIGTHLGGAFNCSRAVLPEMMRRCQGKIINITSVSGVKGVAGQCNYSAAKAGLIGFSKALAREVGSKNITCNAIALGMIDTDMTRSIGSELRDRYRAATALGRIGEVSEVSDMVEFLASPKSAYMTGQVLSLDGGLL